ncbi:MAG TPA: hypothetical protein PKA00_05780 [Saprospiraceae bacterium]|nr:hypothetical protein [Saprospiraceae bacterium]HMQ82392.1 hypothetical protein [Saprospiraceae bacterium]
MKASVTLLGLLFFSIAIWSQNLAPHQPAPLYLHLYEVNKQWATQLPPTSALLEITQFKSDEARIQRHLQLVEQTLRERTALLEDGTLQANRLLLLDALHSYWQQGLFPKNTHHAQRQPYFVDDYNTACAVGQLLLVSGERELVNSIRQQNNYNYLADLLPRYPQLGTWAAAHGFSADELAWIQPAYLTVYFTPCAVGDNSGVEGEVNVMKATEEWLYFGGQFEMLAGFAANNFAAYDGENWRAFPGLEGEVDDFAFIGDSLELVTIGNFVFDTLETQAAWWKNGQWHPIATNDIINGKVYQVECFGDYCYFGGIFQYEDQSAIVAYHLPTESWQPFHEQYTTSGYVLDMDSTGDTLVFGGQFHLMEGNEVLAEHIARFDLETGQLLPLSSFESGIVEKLAVYKGGQYISALLKNENISYSMLYTSNNSWWTVGGYPNWLVRGIDKTVAFGTYYGSLPYDGGYYGIGFTPWESAIDFWPVYPTVNAFIHAMTRFKAFIYFAGNFTTIGGENFNQLAKAGLLITEANEIKPHHAPMTVVSDGQQLMLHHFPIGGNGTVELYDVNGRLLWSDLVFGTADVQHIQTPASLPNGMILYRLMADEEMAVGKVLLLNR